MSNVEEMILAYMLTGLSFDMLMAGSKSQTFHGLHKSVTVKSFNEIQQKFGRGPDDGIQLSHPNVTGPEKSY